MCRCSHSPNTKNCGPGPCCPRVRTHFTLALHAARCTLQRCPGVAAASLCSEAHFGLQLHTHHTPHVRRPQVAPLQPARLVVERRVSRRGVGERGESSEAVREAWGAGKEGAASAPFVFPTPTHASSLPPQNEVSSSGRRLAKPLTSSKRGELGWRERERGNTFHFLASRAHWAAPPTPTRPDTPNQTNTHTPDDTTASTSLTDGAWSLVAGALRTLAADAGVPVPAPAAAAAAAAASAAPLAAAGLDALNAVGQAAVDAASALDAAVESLFVSWGSPAAARKAAARTGGSAGGVAAATTSTNWDDDGWEEAAPVAPPRRTAAARPSPLQPVSLNTGTAAAAAATKPNARRATASAAHQPWTSPPVAGPASPEVADLRARLAALAAENASLKRAGGGVGSPAAAPPTPEAAGDGDDRETAPSHPPPRASTDATGDALVTAQLEALLAEKAALAAEVARLRGENAGLADMLAFAAAAVAGSPGGSACGSPLSTASAPRSPASPAAAAAWAAAIAAASPGSPVSPAAVGATPRRRSPLADRARAGGRAGAVAASLESAAARVE